MLLIEKPKAGTIRVAFDRLSRCPKEISGTGRTQEEPTEEDNEEPLSGVLQEESCDQLEGPGLETSSDPLEDNRPVAQTAAQTPSDQSNDIRSMTAGTDTRKGRLRPRQNHSGDAGSEGGEM